MRTARLFISSPADVAAERKRLQRVVDRLNGEFADIVTFETIRWETSFYSAHAGFQEKIPEARDCDLVIAVLWSRLGTPLPPSFGLVPSTMRAGISGVRRHAASKPAVSSEACAALASATVAAQIKNTLTTGMPRSPPRFVLLCIRSAFRRGDRELHSPSFGRHKGPSRCIDVPRQLMLRPPWAIRPRPRSWEA